MRDDGTARGAEGMLHLLVCAVPTHFSNIISNFVVFQILFQTLTGAAPGLVERMVRFSVAFYRYFFVTRIVEKLIVPNSTFCYPGGSNGRKLALTVLPRRCKGSVVLERRVEDHRFLEGCCRPHVLGTGSRDQLLILRASGLKRNLVLFTSAQRHI